MADKETPTPPKTPTTPAPKTNPAQTTPTSSNVARAGRLLNSLREPSASLTPTQTPTKFTPFVGHKPEPQAKPTTTTPHQQKPRHVKAERPAKRWELPMMGKTSFLGGQMTSFTSTPAPRATPSQVTTDEGAPPASLGMSTAGTSQNFDEMDLGAQHVVDVDFAPVSLPLLHPLSQDAKKGQQHTANWLDAMAASTLPSQTSKLGRNVLGKGHDELFFFQLPSHLPIDTLTTTTTTTTTNRPASPPSSATSTTPTPESQKKKKPAPTSVIDAEQQDPTELENNIRKIPAGYAGKMRIYKSGRVELVLGDTVLDVVEGARCKFSEEVVQLDAVANEVNVLGTVTRHMVCTPNVDDLLKRADPQQQQNGDGDGDGDGGGRPRV